MADAKISALPAVVTPAAADEFACNQSGITKKQTRAQIHKLEAGETLDALGGTLKGTLDTVEQPKVTSLGELTSLKISGGLESRIGSDTNFVGGKGAGASITSATETVFVGQGAGRAVTSGVRNTLIGEEAGAAGVSDFNNNVAIGHRALEGAIRSNDNVAIGVFAMIGAGNSGDNIANVCIGSSAGRDLISARRNVYIGSSAAQLRQTEDNNVYIGHQINLGVGSGVTSGSRCIFLGNKAAFDETGDDRFQIDNTDRGSEALGRLGAILSGVMNADETLQTLAANARFTVSETLQLKERTAALGDIAAEGQLWVKDDTPNKLFFTDDAGTDHEIAFV